MGLSTHVLDTMHGQPATGMTVSLYKIHQDTPRLIERYTLNKEGRTDRPLIADGELTVGKYQLVFHVADYFRTKNVTLPDPPFLDKITLDFGIADIHQHYHVPLLTTPWTYSTYRGS